MHRNTFVFIIILGILAAIVTGVNLGRKPQQVTNTPDTISPTIQVMPTISTLQYVSNECGISLMYPDSFTKIDIETGGATLVNKSDTEESIIVVCQEEIPRVPLVEERIEALTIGSVSANLYHDASPNDGTPIDKLIFTHPKTKKDVYIAGIGENYNKLIQSLKLYP
jgi:hypothetical protein